MFVNGSTAIRRLSVRGPDEALLIRGNCAPMISYLQLEFQAILAPLLHIHRYAGKLASLYLVNRLKPETITGICGFLSHSESSPVHQNRIRLQCEP